jgi:hypothetical protein
MAKDSSVKQIAPDFKVGAMAKKAPIFPGNKTPATSAKTKAAIGGRGKGA